MANYGEEVVYWYLRFNGFFPISNFVLHKSAAREYPSDCDILAVRMPYVHEDVGGQQDDWDIEFSSCLDFGRTIGIIAEVKTGKVGNIFLQHNVDSCVDRLGFTADPSEPKARLNRNATCLIDNDKQIAKILFADSESIDPKFLSISLNHCREFLTARIKKYIDLKYGNRMFFNSSLLQEMIWQCRNDLAP